MKTSTSQHVLQEVKATYNEIAEHFSQTRHSSWQEFEFFKKYLGAAQQAVILDLACGNGRLINFFQTIFQDNSFDYLGIDNSEKLLDQAQKNHPEYNFCLADMLNTKQANETFTHIFNIAAFHHLPNKKLRLEALNEMHRILQKDGLIIMTVWNLWQKKYFKNALKAFFKSIFTFGNFAHNDFYISWKSKNKTYQRYYHSFWPNELKSLFKSANFEIIEEFGVRKGQKTTFRKGFNYCIIAKKVG